MNLSDFNYDLPEELIGQKAIEPRDSCRLLVVNRQSKNIKHYHFSDLVDIIDSRTVLVLNDTKVFPARLIGKKETGGKVEILLLKQVSLDSFTAIGKGKLNPNTEIVFSTLLSCNIVSNQNGNLLLRFNQSGTMLLRNIDLCGKTPLPPYIHTQNTEKNLRQQYQTVYANKKGSAAAPTAGMHFTKELLSKLKEKGIQIEKITLHVGLGTFKPVTPEQVASKTLHKETFFLSQEVAQKLNTAKKEGKKIIAVGTTTCRLLETLSDENGIIYSGQGETNIFIQPGYKFKFVDGLITNFHLPSTSLLMLVSALTLHPNTDSKLEKFENSLLGQAYTEAIRTRYLFFSFGDAMLIL